jgi:hypothetical protein
VVPHEERLRIAASVPHRFRQIDVTRAIRGAQAAGFIVDKVEVHPDGTIAIEGRTDAATPARGHRTPGRPSEALAASASRDRLDRAVAKLLKPRDRDIVHHDPDAPNPLQEAIARKRKLAGI